MHIDSQIKKIMGAINRADFVPEEYREEIAIDAPLPIGFKQTISQPSLVAYMVTELELNKTSKVLEVGTGSGYHTAIVSKLAGEVFTIEVIPELFKSAKERLERLKYKNIYFKLGNGYEGWPEHAPFQRILLTSAPEEVPKTLFDQLGEGGILLAPVGKVRGEQKLIKYRKQNAQIDYEELKAVRFVPMVKP